VLQNLKLGLHVLKKNIHVHCTGVGIIKKNRNLWQAAFYTDLIKKNDFNTLKVKVKLILHSRHAW
jgi:hypothetical protein